MLPRTTVPPQLLELARYQGTVVTRRQALEAGLTPASVKGLVRRGALRPIARGVYTTSDIGWEQLVWAGILLGGPGSSVGGLASAHLLGLCERPRRIDVWAPSGAPHRRPRSTPGPWRFHRGARSSRGNPPHLSVEETVLELSSTSDPDGITSWIGKAVGGRLTTPGRIRAALDRSPGLRNRRLIGECLDAVDGGSHSPLETRYRRDVERAHGLPQGNRQESLSTGTVSDVVYEAYGTVTELDGKLGHRGDGEVRDAWRDSAHLLLGFVTVRFGWADVAQRPCAVAARVAQVLRQRGWEGTPRPCARCPAPDEPSPDERY